jgi:6,7-dimethyl-8-ribityllumazine synthase
VDTMQQALERAGIKSNKGWDYAMNALEMASLMKSLRQGKHQGALEENTNAVLPAGTPSPLSSMPFNS